MEKYQNIQKKTRIGLTLSTILVALAIVISIYILCRGLLTSTISFSIVIHHGFNLVLCVFLAYYAIKGYKKPHGNMLRILYVVFAISIVIKTVLPAGTEDTWMVLIKIIWCLSALIVMYVAGRLNKIEKNKKLILLVVILQVIRWIIQLIYQIPNIYGVIGKAGVVITMFALFAAYFARYEEHKEAGLADAPKTE